MTVDVPTTKEFILELKTPGSDIGDENWQIHSDHCIRAWEIACRCLDQRLYSYGGHDYIVTADWNPALSNQKKYDKNMGIVDQIMLHNNKAFEAPNFPNFQQKRTKISLNCFTSEFNNDNKKPISSIVSSYVFDIYLIMELSCPGSIDMYLCKLIEKGSKNRSFETEINLSNHQFDFWSVDDRQTAWLKPIYQDVEDVSAWYSRQRNGVSQTPKSAIEKALFSLWHISRSSINPLTIVLIFYALEALFCTKPGENKAALLERIAVLHDLDKEQKTDLKRKIGRLYEKRSAIVHGGMKILHPGSDESVDNSVENEIRKVMDATDFGFSLLGSSLQKIIQNGWHTVEFDQKTFVRGVKFEKDTG